MGNFDSKDLKKFASITAVLGLIIAAFKIKFNPQPPIPPEIIYIGATQRDGLSAIRTAANIISRQQEAGAPVGKLKDGSDNVAEKMERIRIEEIFNALQTEGRVDIAIPPGVPVSGVVPGVGPFFGSTTNFIQGRGTMI